MSQYKQSDILAGIQNAPILPRFLLFHYLQLDQYFLYLDLANTLLTLYNVSTAKEVFPFITSRCSILVYHQVSSSQRPKDI